jgi:ATP-dependent RNA helicase DDX47/RRP3
LTSEEHTGVIGKKMEEYPLGASGKQEALLLSERVGEAQREAIKEVKEFQMGNGHAKGKGKRRRGDDDERDRDDDEREAGMPVKRGGKGGGRGGKRRR